ncbi:MAG: beta-ketoacyl-[acyl-carrier-protein] synthase family protein [Burkholderiaceae bacterium]
MDRAKRMDAHRVVVSGRGVVSAIGNGIGAFRQGLLDGFNGIGPVEGQPTRIGAAVRDPGRLTDFIASNLPLLDRTTQLALLAADQAIAECGLETSSGLGPRVAVIVGTSSGCLSSIEDYYSGFHADRNRRQPPLTVPRTMYQAFASHISLAYGITGPAFMISTACASSAYAVALGMQMIRAGTVDVAVVGGSEACLTEGAFKAWEALRVLAPDTCRPFSKGRRGLVLGEGAAIVVLESLSHARGRGAPIHGEIAGCAMNSDAFNIMSPSLDGQVAAIRACLVDAQMGEGEIDYINAHGTATHANDLTETRAIQGVFGGDARRLAVSSTKSMHGHTLGAAGAMELVATLLGLEEGFVPPTMNYVESDPECPLDYVPNEAQRRRCGAALSNSFAFGGHNAVLAVRSPAFV